MTRAFKSDWIERRGERAYAVRRCITLLFTNAEATPLEAKMDTPGYPEDMPRNEKELEALWDEMSMREKRLLIFAPECEEWQSFAEGWEGVVHKENVRFLGGCDDVDIDALARMIADIGR